MTKRIGVYVCGCGPNIAEAVDVDELVRFAQKLDGVVFARSFGTLCSDDGKELLKNEIREHDLSAVVIAACSPKEHEATFRRVLSDAGVNPFVLQMANVREHCAWVTDGRGEATDKAKRMIAGAVERVARHEPLELREIDCEADVLIVGAGVAGISAALTLAQKNRRVYVVEKLPCVGGKVARYEEVFPGLECASCMLDPKLDELLHHERIEVLTNSEVTRVLGSYGNYTVTVEVRPRSVDPSSCIGCGACLEVCPVAVSNEFNEGLDERPAIYVPYRGALPNVPIIDRENCIRFRGQDCDACRQACPFGCIDYEDRGEVREIRVGAIVVATGFDVFDPVLAPQYGYGMIENVYTSLEFERLLCSSGPSEGRILLRDGRPPSRIVFIHCVGSRTQGFLGYCSGICCLNTIKQARLVREKLPEASVVELYADFCVPGRDGQIFLDEARDGVEFHRMKGPGAVEVRRENGSIAVAYVDPQGARHDLPCDAVVLACGMQGARDGQRIGELLDLELGNGGFFVEEHAKLAPVSTTSDGIYVVGCAQAPKDVAASVAQAQAAAGMILSRLVPGEKLPLEPMCAVVDGDVCSGCRICNSVCPYGALSYDGEEKRSVVNEALCRGCGTCAATCPSGAITANHFSDEQLSSEIRGVLRWQTSSDLESSVFSAIGAPTRARTRPAGRRSHALRSSRRSE